MRHVVRREESGLALVRSMWGMVRLVGLMLAACVELLVRRPSTRLERAMWLHRLCRRAVEMFRVEVCVEGSFPERGVVISNHLSYLDIVIFASIRPCVFVSKVEIESWPVIGWMTTMAGTVYVKRGKGGSAKEAGSGMRTAAESGLPVVFFPEGTTSNGEQILKFHSGLLMEAVVAEQPVTAGYLRYLLTENNRGREVRDDVAYWGDRPMLPHVIRFMALRGVRAEVAIASEPIRFTSAVGARKAIAIEARTAVCMLSDACRARPEAMEPVG